MKVKIDIETKVFVRLVLVVFAFGLAILAVYKARTALTLLATALFLALALNPPVSKISKQLPGNSRIGATALAYLLVLALLGGFLVLVVPPVVEQTSKFAATVPTLIDDLGKQKTIFDDFIQKYGLESTVENAINSAKSQATEIASNLGNILVGSFGALLNGLASTVLVLVLTFLMLIEGPTWMGRLWGLYDDPVRLERHKNLVKRMYKVVTGFVNGQVAVATIASLTTLVALLAITATLDLPTNLAVPLAVIIFFTNMIPMIGSTIGGSLVALVLLLNSWTAAVAFLIFFLIYQQIENNFISPTIQAKNVELSALLILSAILVGGSLYGLLGALVAIPVAGCLRVLWLDNLDYARRKRESLTKNPLKKIAKAAKS